VEGSAPSGAENQGLGFVNGVGLSKMEEEPISSSSIRRARNVRILDTRDSFAPTVGKREKSRKPLYDSENLY
jgi:hypothetical protein